MATGQARWDRPGTPVGYAASKVPLITAYFWIIKLLSTAMGEATSDYMVRVINPIIAVLFGAAAWAVAMVLQFRAKRYNAWIYWLAVVMVAVFGTMCADVLHIKFHVPYVASTAFYAIVLAVIFVLWYRSEGTLSIHSIRTPRREFFYWATVLATFALGTATGDLTAKTLNLGYLASGIWFSLAFAAVAVAHWKFGLNSILAFWVAYVLTRPVGASFADYVAFPRSVGGLDQGHAEVALVLTFFIVCLVGYMAVTRKDVEEAPEAPYSRAAPSRHRREPSPYEPRPYEQWPREPGSYEPGSRGSRPYEASPYDPRSREPGAYEPPPYEPPSREPRSYEPRSYEPPPGEPRPQQSGPYDPRPQQSGHYEPRPQEPRRYEPRSPEPRSYEPRSHEPRSYDPSPHDPRPPRSGPYDPRSPEPPQYDPRPCDPPAHDSRSYDSLYRARPTERPPADRRQAASRRLPDDVDPGEEAEQTREGFFMWDDQ
jgi:uncharacterized membrane-anchored protein